MKYLFYYTWLGMAIFYKKLAQLTYKPMIYIVNLILRKTDEELAKARQETNNAMFEFPHGVADWWAFALFGFIFMIPIGIFTLYFNIDIYHPKIYAIIIFALQGLLLYYIIYFRNIDWLKKKIREAKKKYKIEI